MQTNPPHPNYKYKEEELLQGRGLVVLYKEEEELLLGNLYTSRRGAPSRRRRVGGIILRARLAGLPLLLA